MQVLILDDREEDLATLDAIISARGHAVTRGSSGEEGLRALLKAPADLIICDAVMQGMDGVTMLKELRKDQATARIPFYVTTAVMVEPDDEKFFFDLGATGIIKKPFDPKVIQKVLEDAAPGAGKLNLGVPPIRPMGDDTFVDRYTDRLVDKLEKRVTDLQASMRFIDEVLNAMAQPVVVIGDDFRILRANAAAARRLGAGTAAELNGKSCYRAVWGSQTPCAFEGHTCPLKRVIYEKKAVRHEAALDTPSFKGRFAVTFDPCAAHADAKAALLEQIFDAPAPAEARPARAQVTPAIHDLKNTLTGIVGYTQVLLDELPADLPQRKTVEALARLVDKASDDVKARPATVELPAAPEPPKQAEQSKPGEPPGTGEPPKHATRAPVKPDTKSRLTKTPAKGVEPAGPAHDTAAVPAIEAKPAPMPVPPAVAPSPLPAPVVEAKPAAPAKEPDISGVSLPPLPPGVTSTIDGTLQTKTPPAGAILLIDDEEAILEVGKRLLEKHRLTVLTSSDLDEALIIFEARRDEIDVVVLDSGMPGTDVEKACEQFVTIDEAVRIIVAGPADHAKRPAIAAKGSLAWVAKPYDAAALLAAVQEGLAKPLPPEKAIRKSQLPRKARMRLLLVDDEDLVIKTLDRGLRRDFDIVALSSAQAAMELLGLDRDFDWIVSDLNMPGKTGLDLFTHVKEKVPALAGRFVFLTGGAASLELTERLAQQELVSFDKPINSDVLRAFLKGEPPPAG